MGLNSRLFHDYLFKFQSKESVKWNLELKRKRLLIFFGIETIASAIEDENFQSPSQLWQQCHKNSSYEQLVKVSGDLPPYVSQDLCKIHGAVNYRKTENNTYPYMLCAFVGDSSHTEGYTIAHIPSQTYAIFPSRKFKWHEDFSTILTTLQKRFYSEWLPTSNYEKVDGPEFEIYGGTPEDGYIELWYPVVKR